jgi:hypothetical protein
VLGSKNRAEGDDPHLFDDPWEIGGIPIPVV